MEDLIRQVTGSMALSGFELTEEDKERIRTSIDRNPDDVVRELVEKHRQRKEG